MLCRIISQKATDVSKVLTASIIRAMRLQGATSQMAVTLVFAARGI
jgi:hypothetical protein